MARDTNPAAQTAFGPMVLAAIEQYERPGRRLVDDNLAGKFLPAGLRWLVGAMRWPVLRRTMVALSEKSGPGLWANMACRKRFVDEKLSAALSDLDAVVILGAGMDTQAYRLADRSDIPAFEVDLPVNIERKARVVRRVLGATPRSVHLVPIDFERDDLSEVLTAHGHRTSDRTFFVWEGVTQYLTEEAVRATFEYMTGAAPGSRLVFTYVQQDFIDGANLFGAKSLYWRFRQRRQIWQFGMRPTDVGDFVAQYGWKLTEQAGPEYYLQRYIQPAGRALGASQLEWSAYAEKT